MRRDDTGKTVPALYGWAAVIVGLLAGWWVWQWQAPTGDEINAAGAGAIVLVGFAAFWTVAAFAVAAWATLGILRGLGAVARFFASNFAEGWRRVNPKDS
jgi:hypothetical protein